MLKKDVKNRSQNKTSGFLIVDHQMEQVADLKVSADLPDDAPDAFQLPLHEHHITPLQIKAVIEIGEGLVPLMILFYRRLCPIILPESTSCEKICDL